MYFSQTFTFVLLLVLPLHTDAHSWIDKLYATAPDGTVRSTGYPRSYQGHIDLLETYHLMDPLDSTPLCMASQQSPTYSAMYPMLTAMPGDNITALYDENGHITVDKLPPDGKPHPGYYAWLWGSKGQQLTTVSDMLDVDNVLAGPFPFDDGKCSVTYNYGRVPQPCVSEFTLSTDIMPGVYNVVWAWHFPKIPPCEPGAPIEFYTTCMDIKIISS
ncbi:hypothetical protein V1512DRAFT_235591 [Lipomyces arxii]|uniref:uncharacterized protein n=1 Tax=Lipomyces arxii TaxID=56418 RepID=UPI0034CDE250